MAEPSMLLRFRQASLDIRAARLARGINGERPLLPEYTCPWYESGIAAAHAKLNALLDEWEATPR